MGGRILAVPPDGTAGPSSGPPSLQCVYGRGESWRYFPSDDETFSRALRPRPLAPRSAKDWSVRPAPTPHPTIPVGAGRAGARHQAEPTFRRSAATTATRTTPHWVGSTT